jgi:hypothetical protein
VTVDSISPTTVRTLAQQMGVRALTVADCALAIEAEWGEDAVYPEHLEATAGAPDIPLTGRAAREIRRRLTSPKGA